MTVMYENSEELNSLFDSFYRYVKHPYINKFIKNPEIDEDQAGLLFLMLKEKGAAESFIHDCVLTAMLVQAALDIHENVDTGRLESDSHKTKRQLSVLAGDYYSSLYYFVLSRLENVSLIRVFAKSIQEINEAKMTLYKQHKKSADPSLQDVKIIYSTIHTNIAELFDLTEWNEELQQFFILKALLQERFHFLESGHNGIVSRMFDRIEKPAGELGSKMDLISQYNTYIDLSISNLHQLLWQKPKMQQIFQDRMDNLIIKYQFPEHCAVEEG